MLMEHTDATDRPVNFWERDRPVPSRQEIAEMTDLDELEDMLDALEATAEKIRVGLEFPYDDEWGRRAKKALTFFLVTAKRVNTRRCEVMGMEGAEPDPELEAFLEQQKQEKKQRQLKHQELAATQAEASARKDDNRTLRHKYTMLRDINFHLSFYFQAKQELPPEVFRAIELAAHTEFQTKLVKLAEETL